MRGGIYSPLAGAAVSLLLISSCSNGGCEPYPLPGALPAVPATDHQSVRTACAAGVMYRGIFYRERTVASLPDAGDALDGVVLPGCNDGGASEPDVPVEAFAAGDYCITDAILYRQSDELRLAVADPS